MLKIPLLLSFVAMGILVVPAHALTVQVVNENAEAMATVMVTAKPAVHPELDTSDDGYPARDRAHWSWIERTRFTRADGYVDYGAQDFAQPVTVRVRAPGYRDAWVGPLDATAAVAVRMERITDPLELAESLPANVWAAAVELGDEALRKRYKLQCSYCHQQGSALMRMPRGEELWSAAIGRMVGYGSRLPTQDQKVVPALLVKAYDDLRAHPAKLGQPTPWSSMLSQAVIEEIPAGDSMSQMHDMLTHSNGMVYVGDNIQDRLWEINPQTGEFRIYVLPILPGDEIGGLIKARLKTFPRHVDYQALHSLAEAQSDGHIFMTPSNQRRMIEFDPATKQFTVHELSEGLYPHTVRVDAQDRVWFTLALSNQIGMLDRKSGEFTAIDLPARNWREALTIWAMDVLFWLAEYGLPLNKFPIDSIFSGVPLPYGIDVSPADGSIWFARLHANDIGRIDPENLKYELYGVPHMGTRRLRIGADGVVWVGLFAEGALMRVDPETRAMTVIPMATQPEGSDTPYSLNVDRRRNIVWVTGTASDTLQAYDVARGSWSVFPLPRKVSFTRDIEIAEDGSVYSSNGAFPAWHIEDGQPTLIHVIPPWSEVR